MSIIFGPVIPSGYEIKVLFHFGQEDGHRCDCAKFDWYVNDIFKAFLNFNNSATGETIYQGPFLIDPDAYEFDACGHLVFSFECKSMTDCGYCHEGAKFDVTQYNGEIITRYVSTSVPTEFTICELMAGYSSPP